MPLSTPKGNRMGKLAVAAKRQLPIIIGATALIAGGALASAGSAGAADHGSQIRNYPLKQVDVGKAGVSGTRVGQDEIAHQSIGQIDIGENGVSGSAGDTAGEIAKGSVGENDLGSKVQGKLDAKGKDGVSGYEVVGRGSDAQTVGPDDGVITLVTKCASSDSSAGQQAEVAFGGGATGGAHVTLHSSTPSGIKQVTESDSDDPAGRWKATSWTVKVSTDKAVHVQPYVVCAAVN